jgi:hypothetical protein
MLGVEKILFLSTNKISWVWQSFYKSLQLLFCIKPNKISYSFLKVPNPSKKKKEKKKKKREMAV